MPETLTCSSCKETVDYDEAMSADLTEDLLCDGCYSMDLSDHVSTITRFNSEGEERVIFGDYRALDDSHGDEPPDWFTDLLPKDWTQRPYVRTDAWRGYYDTSKVLVGLVEVENGWVADAPWKMPMRDFLDALHAGQIVPPVPVYLLFEPTSNVFSTATTIMVAETDVEAYKTWVNSTPYTEEVLHAALS